ncbi:ribosome biogenesis protein (Rrs1), putative [Talaromyces stipitatus ATCC 10500]|uniref:Ribosome biogenesis regulatory protein n=1 Tax=Talaromyces stipitatus (strain ATCC 10500 / CBS 375.48 / QM 6759 / NRRL 1006) TaxID=441959 RepID=B8MDM5_TALSN|nr:ribosome biogenesis protein (Rrs1), putative [Talaromyces stipitatus ATCC 10500]EED18254.1 ribosome biogenesis protein (Rrs1), putative [Talaromyces stipitatus ATCC 10500]
MATTIEMMDVDTAKPKNTKLPITVTKENPYTFDLGHLLAQDPNPLVISKSESVNNSLKAVARDGAQVLLNQLLTTCPVTSNAKDGVLLSLPPPNTLLPRYKPLPKPKEPTKWELFARKKGIGKYSSKPGAALAEKERRKKLVYDEASGEWVPRWGFKGANKSGENDWVVEVPDKEWKNEAEGKTNVRTMGRAERKERIKRNERKMRANERRSRKFGA